VVLGVTVAFLLPAYRSARRVPERPETREAIEGYVIGAAIRFRMVYEVAVGGLLLHIGTLLAVVFERRRALVAASLCMAVFGMLAVFLALVTQAPILAVAAATSVTLAPLTVLASMQVRRAES
jgi:hypothetical protein